MLMFTLAISCLTTSNLPWFVDLIFQVLMQYCSLQHRTLLPSPVTSTTECCFCFGLIFSFFLELFLHWSPVAYWAPNDLGNSSFSVLSFCLFILFMGFSRQEYWSGLPFPSPGNAKECSNYHTIALISHAIKVMLKILQARLQQYMNQELPDIQAGFRKGRGTRDQISDIQGQEWRLHFTEAALNRYPMSKVWEIPVRRWALERLWGDTQCPR